MSRLSEFREAQHRKNKLKKIQRRLKGGRYQVALALLEDYLLSNVDDWEAFQRYLITCRQTASLPRAVDFLANLTDKIGESNPYPTNYLAAAYYLQGDMDAARSLWEGLVQRYCHFAPGFANLGALYLHLGRFDLATLQFQVAVALDPENSISAYNNLAEIKIAQGAYQEAISYLKQGLTYSCPGQVETLYANLGHCYLVLGYKDKAVEAYEQSLRSQDSLTVNESKAEVHVHLARLYLERHQPELALKTCQEGVDLFPQNPSLWAGLGRAYLALKNYEEAITAFQKSLSFCPMSPRNIVVHRNMALAYFNQGKYAEATAEYRSALAWHPDFYLNKGDKLAYDAAVSVQTYRQLAYDYFILGNFDGAIAAYQDALKLDANDIESYVGLGFVYFALDQHLAALYNFAQAVERDPGCVKGHLGQGETYLSQGSTNMAIIKFKWAVSIDSTNARAYNLLGKALEIEGNLVEAEECYRTALSIAPNYAQAHFNLGNLFQMLGQYTEAIQEFQAALKRYPDYLPALCLLGLAYQKKGDYIQAENVWREALKVNPNNPLASDYLERIGAGKDLEAAEV